MVLVLKSNYSVKLFSDRLAEYCWTVVGTDTEMCRLTVRRYNFTFSDAIVEYRLVASCSNCPINPMGSGSKLAVMNFMINCKMQHF